MFQKVSGIVWDFLFALWGLFRDFLFCSFSCCLQHFGAEGYYFTEF